MTRKETEELLQRYMDGLTSREEECLLGKQINAPDALEHPAPEDLAVYRLMLQPLPPLAELLPQEEAEEEYRRMTQPRRKWSVIRWAASIAIVVGLAAAWQLQGSRPASSEVSDACLSKNTESKKETIKTSPAGESCKSASSESACPLTAERKQNKRSQADLIAGNNAAEASRKRDEITANDALQEQNPYTAMRTPPLDYFLTGGNPDASSAPESSQEAVYASLVTERLMHECERILLEEEYQNSEHKMRVVEL